jgi:hypothetical protein
MKRKRVPTDETTKQKASKPEQEGGSVRDEPWFQARQARWTAVEEAFEAMRKKYGIGEVPCGTSVGPGWLPIIDEALGKMVAAGWDRKLAQVKQKFCGIRIYVGGASSAAIEAIIRDAEAKCARACEHCGAPRGLEAPRNGIALCADCEAVEEKLWDDAHPPRLPDPNASFRLGEAAAEAQQMLDDALRHFDTARRLLGGVRRRLFYARVHDEAKRAASTPRKKGKPS